ncbi:MAG: sigma-70 family RNA polymerase sigma factor [Candidatus Eremiobacteraeota bacterium]|nr:sigma-70 family RNA polymerase sigma factor [Candidatus Eremiobacteraeota bacterium]
MNAYRPLCRKAARKFERAGTERADLEQVAALGLIKAAHKYRPEMRTPFRVYAWIMIVGELMHEVRDRERLVRVPRSLRALDRRYQDAWAAFCARHQREPQDTEIARELGVRPRDVAEVRALRRTVSMSDEHDSQHVIDGVAEPYRTLPLEERLAISLALERLGERERTIVLGTYGADLTQMQLGARLGLSQSHISKLLARALHQLAACVA